MLESLTILDLLTIAAVFVLILSVWIGGVVLWSARKSARRKQVEHRLGLDNGSAGESRVLHLWHDDGEESTVVVPDAGRVPLSRRMQKAIDAAGLNTSLSGIILTLVVAIVAVGGAVYAISGHAILGILASIVPPILFTMYVRNAVARRAALFERQFVDAMQLAARSLRSGHPLMGAFQLVSEEMPPPVSDLFEEICQQHEMGASLEDSLAQAAEDAPTTDVGLFAASVAIQVNSGGSLSDMMDRLAAVIRDRMRIARRTRVLSAQTQLSKRVLIGLPIVMFILLNVIATEYMSAFYETTAGNIMLAIGVTALVMGSWVMNRLAIVRY